jgi:hypothetical protein
MPQPEDGQQFHAHMIVRAIEDHEEKLTSEPKHPKFLCSINDDQFEETISYNDLMNLLKSEEDGEKNVWKL